MKTQSITNNALPLLLLAIITVAVLSQSYFLLGLRSNPLYDLYQDYNNTTYLYNYDTFLHYRLAKNLMLYNGEYSNTTIINSDNKVEYADTLRHGRKGNVISFNIISEIIYFVNIYTKISVEKTAFFLPVCIGSLSIIIFFFICKEIIPKKKANIYTSLLLLSSYYFTTNNLGGYADTQVLALLISLLLIYIVLQLIKYQGIIKLVLLILIFALFQWLLPYIWRGLSYINVVFIMFILLVLLKYSFSKKNKTWIRLGSIIFFIILAIFLIYFNSIIFSKINNILGSFTDLINISKTMESEQVSELQRVDLAFPSLFFNIVLILLALAGFCILLKKILRKELSNNDLLVLCWCFVTLVPSIFANRFVLLFLPPFYILIGGSLDFIDNLIPRHIKLHFFNKRTVKLTTLFCFILLLFVLFSFYLNFREVSKIKPAMNDAILDTALFLKNNTSSDAIINVRWGEGYIWQAYSDRATLLDGGLFLLDENYWFNQALLSNDENESAGLIRTINCFESVWLRNPDIKLHPNIKDYLLKFLIKNPKEKASDIVDKLNITNYINVNLTHCQDNPELILIISQDSMLKIEQMSKRKNPLENSPFYNETIAEDIIILKKLYNVNDSDARNIYESIMKYHSSIKSSKLEKCTKSQNELACLDGILKIDLKTFDAVVSPAHSIKRIILYGDYKYIKNINNASEISVVIFKYDDNNYISLTLSDSVADSTIIRLFGGEKLDNFELIYQTNSPKRIMTYKVRK